MTLSAPSRHPDDDNITGGISLAYDDTARAFVATPVTVDVLAGVVRVGGHVVQLSDLLFLIKTSPIGMQAILKIVEEAQPSSIFKQDIESDTS